MKTVASDEFAMSGVAANEADAQSAITETDSLTAPTAVAYDVANQKNVIQIMQRGVVVSYKKMTDVNRLKFVESGTSGFAYGSDPLSAAVSDELAFQTNMAISSLTREFEISALGGSYAIATAANVANKMRGIVSAATTNTVAASSAQLSKGLIDQVLLAMAGNGSYFRNVVIFANAYQRMALSSIYGFAPAAQGVGGVSVDRLQTDFGSFEIVFDRHIAAGTILFADMAYCHAVSAPVPGKSYLPGGLWLREPLAKTGAAEKWQLFGQVSIDYGAQQLHGTITGLATA
jgi:hypothetical protein